MRRIQLQNFTKGFEIFFFIKTEINFEKKFKQMTKQINILYTSLAPMNY